MKVEIIPHIDSSLQAVPGTLYLKKGVWTDLNHLQQVIKELGESSRIEFAPMIHGANRVIGKDFTPKAAQGKWECSLGESIATYECEGAPRPVNLLHPALVWEHPPLILKPALFLDRDGILNEDFGYVSRYEDIQWVPGIFELIQTANQLGLMVFVVTNQGGVAYGHYSEADVLRLHARMQQEIESCGGFVDEWAYAPTHGEKGEAQYKMESFRRKPYPGMLLELARDYGVDLTRSVMIGDKLTDHLRLIGPEYFHLKGKYDLSEARTRVFENLFDLTNCLREKFS